MANVHLPSSNAITFSSLIRLRSFTSKYSLKNTPLFLVLIGENPDWNDSVEINKTNGGVNNRKAKKIQVYLKKLVTSLTKEHPRPVNN